MSQPFLKKMALTMYPFRIIAGLFTTGLIGIQAYGLLSYPPKQVLDSRFAVGSIIAFVVSAAFLLLCMLVTIHEDSKRLLLPKNDLRSSAFLQVILCVYNLALMLIHSGVVESYRPGDTVDFNLFVLEILAMLILLVMMGVICFLNISHLQWIHSKWNSVV
jgi:hypothetical protein